jgi:hypothetical protein
MQIPVLNQSVKASKSILKNEAIIAVLSASIVAPM